MPAPVISIFAQGRYDQHIARGAQVLNDGGIVVLPTETVYGAAALLTRSDARKRLGELRQGPSPRPFTIHLARAEMAGQYLDELDEYQQRLVRKLWPGPVSLNFQVSDTKRRQVAEKLRVPQEELYDQSTITLRCPDHVVATDILEKTKGPVGLTAAATAPSEMGAKADLIFDAGPTKYSKPSTVLKVLDGHYEIIRPGVYDERIIDRLLRTTILFVCSGNTCRSAMAEAITRRVLSEKLSLTEPELEKKGISVISAGAVAMPGAKATPQAVEAVKDLGADLSHHRSKPLSVELIHQADVIFTMSRSHAQAVTALVPSATEKVATLNPAGDIEDPIGGDVRLYQTLAGQLKELIQKRLEEKVRL